MKFRRAFTALVLMAAPATSKAQWSVERRIDAMTDDTTLEGTVVNEQGHTLKVYRIPRGSAVWLTFRLAESALDLLDGPKGFMLRVDSFPANRLEPNPLVERLTGKAMYAAEPKWAQAIIWHGKANEGLSPLLVQLMTGSRLLVRYFLPSGGYKEAAFTLDGGAATAIGRSLEIPSRYRCDLQTTPTNTSLGPRLPTLREWRQSLGC